MYYEIHGEGEPLVCMGGWGQLFCHGNTHHLARGLTDQYQVLIVDYRGIGDSTDDTSIEPTMALYAKDVIDLLDHLGWSNAHFVGLVGMGACVAQEVALARPELVRSNGEYGLLGVLATSIYAISWSFFTKYTGRWGFSRSRHSSVLMSFLPAYYEQHKGQVIGARTVAGRS